MLPAVRGAFWQNLDAARWFSESAQQWAIGEWRRRRQSALFTVECDLRDPLSWPRIDDQFWNRSVAVFSDSPHADRPYVGVYRGIGHSFLGAVLHVVHFGGWGSTSCIGPTNIWEMFELCEEFQEPPGRFDDE